MQQLAAKNTDGLSADHLGLVIDSSSFTPYYVQIFDQVSALIRQGTLSEGQVLCSEGDLARTLRISKMPVRQAFQKLRSESVCRGWLRASI